jgi:hypothetical protein
VLGLPRACVDECLPWRDVKARRHDTERHGTNHSDEESPSVALAT